MGSPDDTFLMWETFNECKNVVLEIVELISNLGCFIYSDKDTEFLGFTINSKKMTVGPSASKQINISATLDRVKTSKGLNIRKISKLIRKLEANFPRIHNNRIYIWYLH